MGTLVAETAKSYIGKIYVNSLYCFLFFIFLHFQTPSHEPVRKNIYKILGAGLVYNSIQVKSN